MPRWPIVLLVALVTVCSPPRPGVFQFAELERAPDRDCVRTAVESVADPGSVSVQEESKSWIVAYVRGGLSYGVQVSPQATPPFYAHYAWGETETPAETLQKMRADLRELTALVEKSCAVSDLSRRVKEHCEGMHCAEIH